jgi:DNA (cytosine-5)-methyltransferase 1
VGKCVAALSNSGGLTRRKSRSEARDIPAVDLKRLEAEQAGSRVKIRDLRANMANSAVNMFKEVHKYASNPHVDLKSFLRDCGIAPEDFRAFQAFSDLLAEHGNTLTRGRLKFDAIKALTLLDDESQRDALNRIEAGDDLSVRDIKRIQREKNPPLTFEEKVFRSSTRQLKARASKATQRMLGDLRGKANELHQAMLANIEAWAAAPSGELANILAVQDEQIRTHAKSLLTDFERLAGNEFSKRRLWGHLAIDNPGMMHLSQVHHSLTWMSNGSFHKGQFPSDDHESFSWSSLDAIAYLAGKAPAKEVGSTIPVDEPTSLLAVDICSGVGGHALGLEAAGFKIAGMIEQDDKILQTIKANRPDWIVHSPSSTQTIQILASSFDTKSKPIDLLSGAIINSAWSATGVGGVRQEELATAVDLVLNLKPRSFIFEIDKHYQSKVHTTHRIAFEKKLIDAGYGVRTLPLSSKIYGVPQARTRAVLIGLLDDHNALAGLKLPRGNSRSLKDLLANVAFPDHSSLGPVRLAKNSEIPNPQRKYDTYVEDWLTDHGKKLTPDISKVRANISDGSFHKSAWGKSGFNSKFEEDGPRLGTAWATIPLTVKTLRRLQGFPDNWEFLGSLDEQIRQVSAAIPPQMIAALAGALRELLTGDRNQRGAWTPWIKLGKKPKDGPLRFRVGESPRPSIYARANAFRWQRYIDDEEFDLDDQRAVPQRPKSLGPLPRPVRVRLPGR